MHSVSVIIPTYNCARLVTEAIESVLAQTYPATQIIVIDDGSKDDTVACLAPYANRITFLQQPNQGVSAARNNGIAHATGDFVAFLDSDDFWHPCKLELQFETLRKNPSLGLLGTKRFNWPHVQPGPLPMPQPSDLAPVPWQKLVVRNYFVTSSIIVRRDLLRQAGPFDLSLHGPEDYDLWIRLAEITSLANLELPLAGYRASLTGLGNQAEKIEEGLTLILKKLFQRPFWKSHGTFLLRQKAWAHVRITSALMFASVGEHGEAMKRVIMSMCDYPLPMMESSAPGVFLRPRILANAILKTLRPNRKLNSSPVALPHGEVP